MRTSNFRSADGRDARRPCLCILFAGGLPSVERQYCFTIMVANAHHWRIAGGVWGAVAPPSGWRSRKFLGCRKFLGVGQKYS